MEKRPEPITVGKAIRGVLLVVAFFVGKSALDQSDAFPVGSSCSVQQSSYGLKNLDAAYDDLAKAQRANDEIGLGELAEHHIAVQFSAETTCLVIDTNFLKHFTFYRQLRILSRPYFGEVYWVKMTSLQKSPTPASPSPPRPETCRDPNELLGASGVCFCKEGYKRDATTMKCIPDKP